MVKKILYGIAVVLFVVLLYHAYDLFSFNQKRDSMAQEKGAKTMAALKGRVDSLLSEIVDEAERLAGDFGKKEYGPQEIEEIIKKSALKIPALQGVTACFEPYAQSEGRRLYCPFYNKGQDEYIFVGEGYDYTDASIDGTAWYTGIVKNGAKWVDPYFGASAKQWFIDYAVPFYYSSGPKKGQVRGTITMSFETKRFHQSHPFHESWKNGLRHADFQRREHSFPSRKQLYRHQEPKETHDQRDRSPSCQGLRGHSQRKIRPGNF